MAGVDGIPGLIPPLVPYPPESVRANRPPSEWQACIDSWLFSLEYRLRLGDEQFSKFKLSDEASGVPFLLSYLQNVKLESRVVLPPQEAQLYRRTYLLLKRLLLATTIPTDYKPTDLFQLVLLASEKFHSTSDWRLSLESVWKKTSTLLTKGIEYWKQETMRNLSVQPQPVSLSTEFRQMNVLVRLLPHTGLVLMTGSDYLENLATAYDTAAMAHNSNTQKVLTEHVYYCLRSLLEPSTKTTSLLLDHLYFLKSQADGIQKSQPQQSTLCSSLICTTSFLRHLSSKSDVAQSKRGQGMVTTLGEYRQHSLHLHPTQQHRKRKVSKGKGKASVNEEMHVHKAAQVSQIHDLFPGLHNRYILKLLDHFGDNVEAVTAGLLEPESLPPYLQKQDDHYAEVDNVTTGPSHDLAPRSTPPPPPSIPHRKNVFDDDEFDRLQISSTKLHRGRKDITLPNQNADEHSRSKAAILSALAAFDSDDDERDDTYDVADVGGTVDQSVDTDNRPKTERPLDQNPAEEILFRMWKDNPNFFARDSKTRISKIRQDIKRDTGMSDEQIEGWAIMLNKDSALQGRLERKYATTSTFRGNQHVLGQTKWRASASGAESQEDSDGYASRNAEDGRRMGQAQIRGTRNWGAGGGGGGRGRGGGNTAGAPSDASTQAARRRKEQGRGRGGATHNRREGRAKKMARGMAGPTG